MRISDWSSDVCSSDLPLRDAKVIERVADAFEQEGGDAWFASDPQRFLGNDYSAEDFEQVTDVVEVWFDSGSTHSFVLEARPELKWPADLYLEGSDQHRGWFHSSLLESARSEEHTSELQSLIRISYAVFCLKNKKTLTIHT